MKHLRSPNEVDSHRSAHSIVLAMATASALVGVAAPAQAGYFVSTLANTGRGYLRGCAAEYNVNNIGGGPGGHFINNDGGGSPCDPSYYASSQGATVTVSGSTDATGTLTAAHDESSVVRLPDAAYAISSADLRTGKVHLSASAQAFSGANATAELNDTLHFTVAGATASTVTYIPVSFAFDGTMPLTSDPATAFGELNYGFSFGNASAYEFGDYGAGYYGYYGRYPVFAYADAPRVGGWVSYSFASYSPLDTRFSGVYAITGATADIPIDFRLGLNATNVALDFLNTGTVGIGRVDGVSFTSDSGVFLAGTAGGVPEPETWVLLTFGFGGLGAMARRQKITVAS